MNLKLLIVTQYFPPEVGAPQNRLFELAVRLQKAGVDVTVLTAMPNYPQMQIYEGYRDKKYVYEEREGLKIHRSSIYASRSKSIIARLRNYFSFVVSASRVGDGKLGRFDFLMCESPPLFLGYTAMYLARRKQARLIFNVSDLWPESAEKLGVVTNKLLLKLAYDLEARLYRRSALVTGQTQGICRNIEERFPGVKTYWLPNGVDLAYYDPRSVKISGWRKKNGFSDDDFIFLYAGIIGIAQGLEVILEAAARLTDHARVKFVLMGSGPEKEKLVALKEKLGLINLIFMDPVTKNEMPVILKEVNSAIIPLKKLDLFKGAIPSKLFEALAMELPVLLGVDGEARTLFIDKGQCGLYFEPGDVASLVMAAKQLIVTDGLAARLGRNGRTFVHEFFNRENIASDFLKRLKELG